MTLFQLTQEKLDAILENPEELFNIDYLEDKYYSINIDKSWDGLKFLLSKVEAKNSVGLSKLISSLQEIKGLEELEVTDIYDVYFLTKEQVTKLSTELSNISITEIKENFDFNAMNENDIYGNPFDAESLLYFARYFEVLKQFYLIATIEQKSVISFIS